MRRWLTCLLVALLATLLAGCEDETPPAPSQGFAGLGAEAGGFRQATPGTRLRFPEDHGPHPDYRLEWWYLTANLEDSGGEPLGVQWTLFRQAQLPPAERPEAPGPWAADQLWMAHMAVSRGATHRVAERFARGGSRESDPERDPAGVTAVPFRAWLDDWSMVSRVGHSDRDALSELELVATAEHDGARFGYRLSLSAEGPLVRHGENGFSQKSADGQGSIYVSQPFYRVSGEVTLDGKSHQVTGRAWLDREWTSQILEGHQQGWDWVSLHLESGDKVAAAQVRGTGKAGGNYRAGTWISPAGETRALTPGELELTPLATSTVAGRELPTRWRLQVPDQDLDLVIEAPHADRWMATTVSYWEGEVIALDRESGETLGEGYLEMTGY
ncbi:lipocalin-like domain-containing protein [Halomonas rhizosphaerae]|uniref:Lipocalin-like domain-containing protein n=1 Tax=Halomonas rhizosphaerae TaxID=3043296 RepID=A0ABT6UZY2_9GAMM|nr:lipocalin-like domain-containing protein [Halomonas rhizosphaerae]MDI5891140.1 lipocalin-like domain-containing protein [Halomonas rhizosphaerae]